MKIGSNDVLPVSGSAGSAGVDRKAAMPIRQAEGGPAGPVAGPPPIAVASAKVELSSSASVLAATSADPTFDTVKVDRIAQAIRDGKFEVNPQAIADKLISNAQELLSRKTN